VDAGIVHEDLWLQRAQVDTHQPAAAVVRHDYGEVVGDAVEQWAHVIEVGLKNSSRHSHRQAASGARRGRRRVDSVGYWCRLHRTSQQRVRRSRYRPQHLQLVVVDVSGGWLAVHLHVRVHASKAATCVGLHLVVYAGTFVAAGMLAHCTDRERSKHHARARAACPSQLRTSTAHTTFADGFGQLEVASASSRSASLLTKAGGTSCISSKAVMSALNSRRGIK